MTIPITPEVGVVLLVLFIGYMLYTNRESIRTRSNTTGKILFAGVVLAQVGLIVGERFFVPPLLGEVVAHDSGLFDLLDIVVFIVLALAVFAVGRRVKGQIV